MREYYPDWKEQKLGMEYGDAPPPKMPTPNPEPMVKESEKLSAEKRSRGYWKEGCEHKKVIGNQLPIPQVPEEWHMDYEWRCWLDKVRKLRESLRCAACYSTTPKEGMRVMMTCSRCRQVRYCSVTCQKKDFKARHRAVCKPCKPQPKGDRPAKETCDFCRRIPCMCTIAEKAKRHDCPDRNRDME